MSRPLRTLAISMAVLLALAACTSGDDKDDQEQKPVEETAEFRPPSATALTALGPTEGRLNLVAPAGYVETGRSDPEADWVTAFTRATGCAVEVTVADGPDKTAELLATGEYDGAAVTGEVGLRLIGSGAVAPINTALVPNYAQVVTGLRGQPWDTVNRVSYGVPQGRSAHLLLYRTDQVRPAPTSARVLYEGGSNYQGKLTAFDSPMTIADAAVYLKATQPALGITNPYALDERQLDAAVEVLRVQRGLISGYWRDYQQAVPAFQDGRVVLGTVTQAIAELAAVDNRPVKAVVPTEGTTGWAASWVLAAEAEHPNCMYKWMDHMLGAEVNARSSEWLGLAPASRAACARTTDRSWCTRLHATDEAFWSKVAMWRSPLTDCRDSRGTECTNYTAWTEAWKRAVSP